MENENAIGIATVISLFDFENDHFSEIPEEVGHGRAREDCYR